MSGPHLFSIEEGSSARAVARLLAVLFPDARTVADLTFGNGRFWDGSERVAVTGLDINPERARDVCADYTHLPFLDQSFDVVIFDPPYHADAGKGKQSVMSARFGAYGTLAELEAGVRAGAAEAWRVARLGILVKIQDQIRSGRPLWMSDWVRQSVPVEPYDVLHLKMATKIIDPKWTEKGSQLSVWRNHATFWAFRRDGVRHKRRRRAS